MYSWRGQVKDEPEEPHSLPPTAEIEILQQWREHVMATIVTKNEWSALYDAKAAGILRKCRPSTAPLIMALVRDDSGGFRAVGFLVGTGVVKVEDSNTCRADALLQKYLGTLAKDCQFQKSAVIWTIPEVYVFEQPVLNVDVPDSRFGRPFCLPECQLYSQPTPHIRANLHETAEFFLSKLTKAEQECILQLGKSLSGCSIRVGTTCSGSDICIPVLQSVLDHISQAWVFCMSVIRMCMYVCMHACMHVCMYVCMYICMYFSNSADQTVLGMHQLFITWNALDVLCTHCASVCCQGKIRLIHVFSAEADERKRNLILKQSPEVAHLWGDVQAFADANGFCYKCGPAKHYIYIYCIWI